MAKLNENYLNVKDSYLFSEIAKRVNKFTAENPDNKVIRLGIGDVTLPLSKSVIKALHEAVDEMGDAATFKGYGPEQGYDFLRNAIKDYYARNGVEVEADEIFVSDGAKSDTGNITDLFAVDNTVLVPDPVYPVYVDTNTMNGRKIIYMDANPENNFLAMPDPSVHADIIYLCSPNNPTGAVYNKEQLKAWVDYAKANNAIILFDSAYEAFVVEEGIPKSIYEIEGAKTCAIELRSFSKTAGFTGMRCGYTVVPKELVFNGTSLNPLWARRQATKFNGVSYITQRAAEAIYTEEGQKEIKEILAYYQKNARVIYDGLCDAGFECYGGVNSPYVWLRVPEGYTSWEFFDELLEKCQVVGTPGSGFGPAGEGYFRLTSFGNDEKTVEAIERIKKTYKK